LAIFGLQAMEIAAAMQNGGHGSTGVTADGSLPPRREALTRRSQSCRCSQDIVSTAERSPGLHPMFLPARGRARVQPLRP